MAVASLVLGIICIFISKPIGAICGLVGIILASVARKNEKTGTATAGLVCSIIGFILCILFYVAACSALAASL